MLMESEIIIYYDPDILISFFFFCKIFHSNFSIFRTSTFLLLNVLCFECQWIEFKPQELRLHILCILLTGNTSTRYWSNRLKSKESPWEKDVLHPVSSSSRLRNMSRIIQNRSWNYLSCYFKDSAICLIKTCCRLHNCKHTFKIVFLFSIWCNKVLRI